MNKESISSQQAFSLIVLFVIGSATLIVMGLSAKLDIWLSILIAIMTSSLIMTMYARILSILPNKNFFETIEILLGKPLSLMIVLLLTWFAFDLGQIVLSNYIHFISTIGLSETPFVIISLSMAILCAIAIKFGFEVLSRFSGLILIAVTGFIILTLLASIKYIHLSDLQPLLYYGLPPVLDGAFDALAFPFAETVVFLLIFPAFKKSNSVYKVYLLGLYVAGLLLLLMDVMSILVFGPQYVSYLTFPTYEVLSIFKVGNFINRMEIMAAAIFSLAIFFKISLLLLGSCKGVAYILNMKDYRRLSLPIALMMVNFTLFSFESIASHHEWTTKTWPFYASIFEIIMPFITFILVEIQYRRYKKALRKK